MTVATRTEIVSTLDTATRELQAMEQAAASEVGRLGSAFEGLASHASAILNLTAAILACIESESVSCVLPRAQALGSAARHFIGERLQATTGILGTVTTEVGLLRQLSRVAGAQEAIALEIKALSVLTNIEVARLGTIGSGFQYLARELADFSKSVVEDTHQLAAHTDSRRAAIEETRRVLSAELPRLREELAQIEVDLGNALTMVESSLNQLSSTPAQFRECVEDIARQIAGVVTAIQTHDITRQQVEHVQQAFELVSARLRAAGDTEIAVAEEMPQTCAGLTIQTHQLRTIRETVANWTAQIRTCTTSILRISASELVEIGPVVLEQERNVSSELARIEILEHSGQAHSKRIQHTLGGLSNLMQLVSEHLQRSKSVRDRLRLLAFNSIIEASHLGTQADAILAISKSIKGISAAWSQVTDQSAQAMQEILALVKQTTAVTEVFSDAANEKLREAQVHTKTALDSLRAAAEFVAQKAQEMKSVTEKMQGKISEVSHAGDVLNDCFAQGDAVLAEVERLNRRLEIAYPNVKSRYNAEEVERLFSAFYTTEVERDVLRSALYGTTRPVAQQTSVGNSVELF